MKSSQLMQYQATAVYFPKNVGKSIRAQVVLGSPSSGCQDVGVCRVIPADINIKIKCPVVTAWISVTEAGGTRFSFLRDSVPEGILKRHFGWGLFQVLERYELPEYICRGLKTGKRVVEPGIYRIGMRQDRIIVDF